MRQGPNPKRSRGRNNNNNNGGGRRPNLPLRMQTFDSNGPDVRIRGTAFQVHEKYLQLARDASSSGDRIMAESYLQHAEHYYRIIAAAQEQQQQQGGGDPNRRYRPEGFAGQDYRGEEGGEGGEDFPSEEQAGDGQAPRGEGYRQDGGRQEGGRQESGRQGEQRNNQERRQPDEYRAHSDGQYRSQGDREQGGDRGPDRNRQDGGYRGDRDNRYRQSSEGFERRNGESHQRTDESGQAEAFDGHRSEAAGHDRNGEHANGDAVSAAPVQIEFEQPAQSDMVPEVEAADEAAPVRRGRPRRPRLSVPEPAEG